MKKDVGLWIDHRRSVIVINLDQEEEVKQISSNVGKRVRYSGASEAAESTEAQPHNDASEDGRDRRFDNKLSHYYDEVITYLSDATSILILGPGEAKVELQKRFMLTLRGQYQPAVTLKTTDKLTVDQIIAEVHQHFQETPNGLSRTLQQ